MLQEKLNSVIKLQVTLAIMAAGVALSFNETLIAFSIVYVSGVLVLGGMSLGAGIVQASEAKDPHSGMRGLYVRAFIRFSFSVILLAVGFVYFALDMKGVLVSLLLYYSVPVLELAKEAMGLQKKNKFNVEEVNVRNN